MSKIVRSIEITFENLDNVEIPAEYFCSFSIEKIHTSVHRLVSNAILRRATADRIAFELKRSVNSVLFDLDPDLSCDWFDDRLTEIIIRYQSITYLTLHYSDESVECFYVPWEDDGNEFRNRLQHCEYNQHGNLVVIITNGSIQS